MISRSALGAYRYIMAHTKVSAAVLLVVLYGFYRVFIGSTVSAQARYVLGTVERGTLVVSVSGVGQISASSQVDVKPKTSADIVSVDVVAGQSVKSGQVLARLDSRAASQALQNATIALQNARISLQKLEQGQVVDSASAKDDVDQAYVGAFNSITGAFLQLPSVIETARGVLYDNTLKGSCSPNVCEYGNIVSYDVRDQFKVIAARAEADYAEAETAYSPAFNAYRELRRTDAPEDIAKLLESTRAVVDLLSQTIKSEQNALDTVVSDMNAQAVLKASKASIPQQITSYQSALASAFGTVNSFATQLASQARTISNALLAMQDATVSNPLDLASQRNIVVQREADVRDAQLALAQCTVRAPFDGVIAKMTVRKGDSASPGTTIATVITNGQLVVVPLNEVDVASIHVGQKTTLTFDAIGDLTMTGVVSQVDSIGTTTQGVVNYNVTVALDTEHPAVRPGMSVTAKIVTDVRPDVLMVPAAAVKKQNGNAYVEVLNDAVLTDAAISTGVTSLIAPERISVTTGASSDVAVEILSGLTEGQSIVARSIMATSTAASAIKSTSRTSSRPTQYKV
jgi:HlyD family secretion protein